MNNINAILDAVGELDNTVLENAFKPARKRHIMLTVIAAAASLSLIVGFTTVLRNHSAIEGEPLVDFNIKIHDEIIIPSLAEMVSMGAVDIVKYSDKTTAELEPREYEYYIDTQTDAKPSEVIEKYNITLLGNENFSEDISINSFPKELYTENFFEEENQKKLVRMYVGVTNESIYFHYWLINKKNGLPVFITANCLIAEYADPLILDHDPGEYEIIDLKNGDKALIKEGSLISPKTILADFTYNGILYKISSPTDIDGMKQVLTDLGITAE